MSKRNDDLLHAVDRSSKMRPELTVDLVTWNSLVTQKRVYLAK